MQLPTLLAKVFGFFRIGYTANGKTMRLDVLVTENLFYGRTIAKVSSACIVKSVQLKSLLRQIFDLKGSKRNRHIVTTGRRGEVLLDENLTESEPAFVDARSALNQAVVVAYKSPLFVREESKKLLRMSLFNDTLFLEKLNVMDYSVSKLI